MSDRLRKAWGHRRCKKQDMTRVGFCGDSILVAPEAVDAFAALEKVFLAHGHKIDPVNTDSYNCRKIAGSSKYSFHAYGIALDVNYQTGPFKRTPSKRLIIWAKGATQDARAAEVRAGKADTDMTPAMIADVEAIRTLDGKQVFTWGGRWRSVKDAMHFELRLTPDELAVGIDWETVRSEPYEIDGGTLGVLPVERDRAHFLRAREWLKDIEGGYVDDPNDPGGATRHGVTIDTLSRVRGRAVSKAEVQSLTYEEATRIFEELYWDANACDDMAPALALVVFNCGVHAGVVTAAKWLQQALNDMGASLETDGVVGPLTLKAASMADTARVIDGVIDRYRARLMDHASIHRYRKGFENRLAALRAEVAVWLKESRQPAGEVKPKGRKTMSILTSLMGGNNILGRIIAGLTGGTAATAGLEKAEIVNTGLNLGSSSPLMIIILLVLFMMNGKLNEGAQPAGKK